LKLAKNLRFYLLIVGIILIGISFFFRNYDLYQVSYKVNILQNNVEFYSRDGFKIKGVLYYPENYNVSLSYPAIVSIHGINSRLEAHIRLNIEFCRRGFFVLGINLRGHAGSEGTCTLSKNEPFDIMGAVDYLYTISQVNKSAIGIIGHSLGAMSSIRAAYNDTRINATVAIAPPPSINILLSYYIENLDISTLQTALGLDFDFSDPHELYLRSPIYWVNLTNPKNLLIQVGNSDTLATDTILILKNATNNNTAEVDKLYGNFSLGTARQYKIYYRTPGIQHEEEPRVPELIVDAILWMENSLLGYEQGSLSPSDLLTWNDINYGSTLFLIGLLLSILPISSYLGSVLFKNGTEFTESLKIPNEKLTRSNKLKSTIIYSLIYFGSSIVIFPIGWIFNITPWTPYNISGILLIGLSIQALLLIVSLIPIYYIEKRLYNINFLDIEIYKRNIIKSTLFGVIFGGYIIGIYFYINNIPSLTIPYLYYPLNFILVILNFIGIFYVQEIYNKILIGTKFNLKNSEPRFKKYKKIIGISICNGILSAISFSSMFIIYWNSYVILGTIKISFALLAFILGFVLFTGVNILNTWIYLKTKNIISGVIVQSLIFAWFTATFMVVL